MTTFDDFTKFLKTEFRHLDFREVLQQSTIALAGVDETVSDLLKSMDVVTIFDLATSVVFDNAASIDLAGDDANHLYRRYGMLRADILSSDFKDEVAIEELRYQGIGILKQIGNEQEKNVQTILRVTMGWSS